MAKRVRKASGKGLRRSLGLERKWRRWVAAWAKSGQTQAAFCRERKIAVASLGWGKRELARRDAEGSGTAATPHPAGGPMFVPVRVKPTEAGASGDGDGIEIVVRGGRRVRVGRGFDAEALAQVVAVLEGVPC